MKTFYSALFVLSLVLNGTLAFFLLTGSSNRDSTARVPSARSPATPGTAAIDASIWPGIQSEDLPVLVSRLRDAGFPPDVIRAIVSSQIYEAFAARRKALDPDANNRPFWKNRPSDPAADLAARQMSRDLRKTLRDVLGDDAESQNDLGQLYRGRGLTHLPKEKADEIRQLVRDFDERRNDLYSAGFNMVDREKIAGLEKAQRDAIAKVLTPLEFEEYELRASSTSSMLRQELSAFNPTEEEFRALFRLRQPFEDQFGYRYGGGPQTAEQSRQRAEAQKLLTEQIKVALTPDRAAEYERATDYNYRQTSQLIARLELPPETTNQVYAVQKEIQQRIGETYRLGGTQRTQQLAALVEETKTKVTAILGPGGYEAYKQYGGSWMQSLAPRSPGAQGAVRLPISSP